MGKKEIPIEQVTENGLTFWVADSHIEEYPEEPTNWKIILDLLKSWVKELLSKLTTK
jgi:hypothetical protein